MGEGNLAGFGFKILVIVAKARFNVFPSVRGPTSKDEAKNGRLILQSCRN